MTNRKMFEWLKSFFLIKIFFMWEKNQQKKKITYGLIFLLIGFVLFSGSTKLFLILILTLFGCMALSMKNKKLYLLLFIFFALISGCSKPANDVVDNTSSKEETQAEERKEKKELAEQKKKEDEKQKLAEEKEKKDAQEKKERALFEAKEAVALAENQPTRDNYHKANALVVALTNENKDLTERVSLIHSTIETQEHVAAESKRIAEEQAEAQRIENERIEAERIAAEQLAQAEEEPATSQGLIKGSVNGIYHVPGSTYYDRTQNVVQWFNTVEEAENAGYRAPKR